MTKRQKNIRSNSIKRRFPLLCIGQSFILPYGHHVDLSLTTKYRYRPRSLHHFGFMCVYPACQHPSYHTVVTRFLPRLEVLDGESLNLRKVGTVAREYDKQLEVLRPSLKDNMLLKVLSIPDAASPTCSVWWTRSWRTRRQTAML